MIYNKKYLLNKISKNEEIEYIFFFGHRKKKSGEISKSCFSQWYMIDFEENEIKYNCAEQFMMAKKAELFKDNETLNKILASNDQKEIKELGREIKNFDESVWNKHKYNIVVKANFLKFSQNEELKTFLIHTRDKIIVEASPYDRIWGIGMLYDDKDAINPSKWKGENLLGFALMEVRYLLDERHRIYEEYAYKHLDAKEITNFKLEYPYAYGTINNINYKIHIDEMIEGIKAETCKRLYNKEFFESGYLEHQATVWDDEMDLDNRYLLLGEKSKN